MQAHWDLVFGAYLLDFQGNKLIMDWN